MGSPDLPPHGVPSDHQPGGGGPYGMNENQEFVAGYLDGLRAGRSAIFNAARRELARFHLAIDHEANVVAVDDEPEPIAEALAEPDNPLRDQSYDDGWERGYVEAHRRAVERIRPQLLEHEVFISDDGASTTLEVASALVSWYRAQVRGGVREPLSDEEIHAFLDSVVTRDATAGRPQRTPPAAPAPTRPSLGRRFSGAWKMIRQNVDRRTALVTLCATLAGSALTWLGLRPEHPDVVTQQPASYVPPTTWDHLNPIVRGTFLAIDSLVYQAEQQGQVAQVQAIAQSIMAMPGQDAGKMYVVRYVTDAPKPAYLMPLLFGLDPSLSGPEVRRLIIAAPERILTKVGPSAVPSVCRVALQTYQTSGFETDPTTTGLLARVISSLIQAGI